MRRGAPERVGALGGQSTARRGGRRGARVTHCVFRVTLVDLTRDARNAGNFRADSSIVARVGECPRFFLAYSNKHGYSFLIRLE